MIRKAISSDVARCAEMGEHFRASTGYAQQLAKNPNKMAELATKLIASDGLLVCETGGKVVGMLGFVVYRHFISDETIAGEIFWWVEPEYRGEGVRLLVAAEAAARARGAVRLQMIAPNKRVARYYRKAGFVYVEETHQKAL